MSLLEAGFGESGLSGRLPRRTISRRQDRERLLIVNGHPDPRPERFCAALCQACLDGALAGGRDAGVVTLGAIFPADDHASSGGLEAALDRFRQPARLTVIFPLWLDKPPEIVTRFFDQVERGTQIRSRRTHVVATMSLPAFAHRSMLRLHEAPRHVRHNMSMPGLEIDALNFVGSVDTISRAQREDWLHRLRRLGGGNS